jgi:hypothetical protein
MRRHVRPDESHRWECAHSASTPGAIRRRWIRPFSPTLLAAASLWRSSRSAMFRALPFRPALQHLAR